MDEYEGIIRSRRRNMRKTAVTRSIFLLSFIFLLGALPSQAQAVWTMDWDYGFSTSTTTDDGNIPYAGLIIDGSGNLYGTTQIGGGYNNYGTVFEISADGTTYNVLHRFSGPLDEGASPQAGLMMDGDGNLYGTTYSGGTYNSYGTVFMLDTDNNLTTLYSFNGSEGRNPQAGLVMDGDGNLYGTTSYGGAYDNGTVFMLDTNDDLTVLHSFKGTRDGSMPQAGLIMDGDGNLYGTTSYGGTGDCNDGCGTVFMLRTASKGKTYTVLHSFAGTLGRKGADGATPLAGLMMDGDGNLYGTTWQGGDYGYGTVFMLSTGKGKKTYTVLHSFNNNTTEGHYPYAGLIMDSSGNLYGTTYTGGSGGCPTGCGTVFMLDSDNTLSTLYNFNGSDGRAPHAGLIMDGSGNLYGTTSHGGGSGDCTNGCGTVFKLAPPKIIFVTSTTYNGNLGGLSGADNKCNERASAAGLPGNYKAWLSDSTSSAASRLTHYDRPYVRPDGVTIAESWTDLTDGSLANPINITELVTTIGTGSAWTGTTSAGETASARCTDWTTSDSAVYGGSGVINSVTSYWSLYYSSSCDALNPLYCVQQ